MLMMTILTMLGMTFLIVADQEQRMSVRDRDQTQLLYLAEAAVSLARSWFNNPGATNPFLPPLPALNRGLRQGHPFLNDYTNARERTDPVDHPWVDGSLGNVWTGGSDAPFEKPYRGPLEYTLWGRRHAPDVLVCGDPDLDVNGDGYSDCTPDSRTWMDGLNDALALGTSLREDGHVPRDLGRIELQEIRVYRPPVDFDLQVRLGIATVEATAVKRDRQGTVVAARTVRDVLQEIPFPGPIGAIESERRIAARGSAGVHWGAVVSASDEEDIELPNYQSGNFPNMPVPRSDSSRWGFHFTLNPASRIDLHPPATDARATALTELLGITRSGAKIANVNNMSPLYTGDPWLLFRARRLVAIDGKDQKYGVQPYPWGGSPTGGNLAASIAPQNDRFDRSEEVNWSHFFQAQVVRFPHVEYATWKAIAESGHPGMHHFQWVSGHDYQAFGSGPTRPWTYWIDANNTEPGVYFFDTTDNLEPLEDGSNLTPQHVWSAGTFAQGFIYLNAEQFTSSGSGGGRTFEAQMPGEIFLDDGIDLADPATGLGDGCICIRLHPMTERCILGIKPLHHPACASSQVRGDDCKCSVAELDAMDPGIAAREASTFRNGKWDTDLDNDGVPDTGDLAANPGWANFIANNDGSGEGYNGGHGFAPGNLPYYPASRRWDQGGMAADWRRDPRFMNHVEEFGGTRPRQPHEPFLNLRYPTTGTNVSTWAQQISSRAPRVDFRAEGAVVAFAADGTTPAVLTTRARDATGALLKLSSLHLNGIMYTEGAYGGTGNINVYGSMLVRGGYSGTGTVDVWYNENLIKGSFPPVEWNLPRVVSSSRDTN